MTTRCESPASGGVETSSVRPVRHRLLGVLLVLLSGLAIAIVPTAAKVAFEGGANTLTVVTLRGVVGVALMALFMVTVGQSFRLPARTFAPCAAAGFAHALVAYGFIGSVAHIPVSLVVLIYATHPILLAFIFHLQGHERLTSRKLTLAFTVLVGLALVLGGELGALNAIGVALAALASLAVCVVILLGARAQRAGATATQVNLVMIAVATIVCGAVTTAGGAWSVPAGMVGWLGLAGAGGGVTIGLVAFFAAFRFIGPVRATMLSNVEPLLGILFAVVVLGERLIALQWTGVALAVAALTLFEASPSRRRAARDAG
ncbi:Threonine/homoserine efflux transporter RhtA [Rhodospirillales bacterium URHD0017]|nr:Threonine/homoserine efflux transporter RhtA [Rhodospirillales bacterium URHD0017]